MLKRVLDLVPTLSAPAFVWREKLGQEEFALLREHWLKPSASRLKSYHCPRCNGSHRVHFHSDSDIVSIPPADTYCEKKSISFQDAVILRFDVGRLAEQLCEALSIRPEKTIDTSKVPCRIGWLQGAIREYPVYLLIGVPLVCEQAAKNLLVDEESPFVLLSSAELPELFLLFKKQKSVALSLISIAELVTDHVQVSVPGKEIISEFLFATGSPTYVPNKNVQITPDFKRIIFPDGYEINLAKAHKRRAVVSFICDQVRQSGKRQFDVEVLRDEYNRRYSDRPWNSDRFKEDLFKGAPRGDFDRLFETIDAALGKYRWLL